MMSVLLDQLPQAVRLLHIAGVCLALGSALLAEALGLSLLIARRPEHLAPVLRRLHALVIAGLAVLWPAGLLLVAIRFPITEIPPKVFVKLAITTVLTVNGILIGRYILPMTLRLPRPAVFHLSNPRISLIVAIASLSATCWLSALLLSTVRELQTLPPAQLAVAFGVVWAVISTGVMAILGGRLASGALTTAKPRPRPARVPMPDRLPYALGLRPGDGGAAGMADEPSLGSAAAAPGRGAPLAQVAVEQVPPHMVANGGPPPRPRKLAQPRPRVTMEQVFKACQSALAGTFSISFVTNMLMLTGPLFMLQIYDRVLTSRSVPTLSALLMLVAGLFVFLGILELLRSRVLIRIGQRIDRILNDAVFRRVISVNRSKDARQKGRLLQDMETLRQFFASPAPAALFDLPWTPVYFAVIFMFHWVLGLLAIAGAAILLALSLYNEFASRAPVARAAEMSARTSAMAEAGRRNAEILHAMGMFDAFRERWQSMHRNGLSHHLKAADISGTLSVTSKVSRLFLQSMMLAAGAYYAILGEISPGVIIAASIILSRALAPLEQSIAQWRNIIAVRQAHGRLTEALDEDVEDSRRIELPAPNGFVSVEKLYAGPPSAREPVLKGLDFYVRPGDAVAVIGANGCGKSTLARVLVGVWPVVRGDVRLDGAALEQWVPEQLGKSVGYLPQDVELFDGTVAENIARFAPDAEPDAIVAAARKAHVHELILRLPDGYATRLGEGGATISGGQRQRIALARALYGDPAFIVLDEPNANLDSEGELALTAAISALRQDGKAIVVMAHRPNVVSAVNLVLVLKDGRQAAFGRKEDVLRNNVTQLKPVKERKAAALPKLHAAVSD